MALARPCQVDKGERVSQAEKTKWRPEGAWVPLGKPGCLSRLYGLRVERDMM